MLSRFISAGTFIYAGKLGRGVDIVEAAKICLQSISSVQVRFIPTPEYIDCV